MIRKYKIYGYAGMFIMFILFIVAAWWISADRYELVGEKIVVNGDTLTVTGYNHRFDQMTLSNGAMMDFFYAKKLVEEQRGNR